VAQALREGDKQPLRNLLNGLIGVCINIEEAISRTETKEKE
jgi:hypothetical protein